MTYRAERAAGSRRIYQVEPEGVEALRAQLDGFWTKALAAYKAVAEQTTEETPSPHKRTTRPC